jgi:hypothetical protein
MIKLQTKITSIKSSNLVFLLETATDIKKLDFIKLDAKIVTDIKKTLGKNKNIKKEYFIGTTQFEAIIILFYLDKRDSLIDSL